MFSRNENLKDLVWSPFKEDEFIAYGSDLWLYKIKNSSSSEKSIKLNDESFAELVVNYGKNSNPKQVSWYCGKENNYLYSISLSNHKIQLISYNPENSLNFEINKEFSFKQTRQCTQLTWNPCQKNLLAGGFDKIRNEHSILVWDVRGNIPSPTALFDLNTESVINCINFNQNKISYSNKMINSNMVMGDYKQTSFKAVYETGNAETCNSLAWNPNQENQLFAGVNGKLKVFDIKSSRALLSVTSKYVHGIAVDYNNQYQMASYFDNQAVIWDIRMFNAPIHKIDEPDHIEKIQWCPKKSGQLAVLLKSRMNFYNIQQRSSEETDEKAPIQIIVDKITRQLSNENEIGMPEIQKLNRTNLLVQSPQIQSVQSYLSNFCWFNFNSNKLLVTSNQSVYNLRIMSLHDKIVLTWSPNGDLYWASKLSNINYIHNLEKEFNYFKELKERTKSNYGLKYYMLDVINGSAHLVQSVNNDETNTSSANGCQATPLALALHSQIGLAHLIRADFANNYHICDQEKSLCSKKLKSLWIWFENVNSFFEKTIPINPRTTTIEMSQTCRNTLSELYATRYCGLEVLLNELDQTIKKNTHYEKEKIKTERFKVIAYNLCGWVMKGGCLSQSFFESLKNDGNYERACCLALLTDNYEQALEILESAIQADPKFGSFWIALRYFIGDQKLENCRVDSGDQTSSCSLNESLSTSNSNVSNTTASQTSNKKNLLLSINSSDGSGAERTKPDLTLSDSFKECSKFVKNFTDPYLRAMFNYMINQEKAKDDILCDKEILFKDRVALSIYFNFDLKNLARLQSYFDLLENECIENSDLNGVLLTGLSPKCLDLFQSFIDRTSDLQSACLAVIHSPYLEVIDSSLVNYWINCYREQLNRFKMWEKRAEFDLLKMKLKKYQTEPEPNIPSSTSSTSSLNSLNTNSQQVNQLRSNSHSYHQIHGAQSRVQVNPVNFSLNSLNTRSNRIATSQSMNFHINLSSNYNVFLNCNSCGKNIVEKLASVSNSINATNNSNSLCHDTSLAWCLNCFKFLPQCVVCLGLMKVNLAPNYSIPHSQSTMNRAQTTPKMYRSEIESKKLLSHNKSPSQLDIHGVVDRHFYLDENVDNQKLNVHDIKRDLQMSKVEILFIGNIFRLNSTKFGNWFSWCMSCHHGGHIRHLMNWFRSNKKCPYLHCKCQCTNLDFIIE